MIAKINEYWHESGHLNEAQRDFLIDVLCKTKPKYCIETGFATGRSTITTLTAGEPDLLVSVDINLDYLGAREHAERMRRDYISLKLIEADTNELFTNKFFKSHFPKGIDFAFIDGDHSYDGVCNDLKWIGKHMNKYGFIVVDDYKSGAPNGIEIPEVNDAVDNFCEANSIEKAEWYCEGKGFAILRF